MSISPLVFVVVVALAGGIGFAAAFLFARRAQGAETGRLHAQAQQKLAEVDTRVKEILVEAKEEAVQVRTAAEREARETRVQAQQLERRLLQKEENLDRRAEDLNRREQSFTDRERALDEVRAQLEDANRQQLLELERVASMTRQEAQAVLMQQVEQDLRNEIARKVRDNELAAREEGERRARAIVTEAIQ